MSRRIVTVGALAGAVLIGGGGVAYAQIQGSSGSYRTAVVSTGDVDKTMNLSGTVTSSSRRDLSFGTSGKVTSVSVAAGDKVHSGQVLAKLDAQDLKNAVTKAKATLASARAKLESDESAQSSTVASAASTASASSKTPSSTASSSPSGSGTPTTSTPDPAVQAALAEVKKQQLAVTSAQTDATAAITAAKAALAAQKTACADQDTTGDTAEDSTPAPTGLSAACTTALDAVQAAQDTVAAKQDALQTALETLSKTLDTAIAAVEKASSGSGGTGSGGTGSGGTGSGGTGSGGTGSGGTGSGGTGSSPSASGGSSASSLAEDQASIDTAKAKLTEAKLAVDSATLTAPYSGRVLSVSVAKGDNVGSSDTVMVLVGDGGTTATTTVTADQIASIKKGQTAEVTPAGADAPVSGTVTSIGLLPDSSSSTVTYPVTIDLADGVTAPEGTTASVAVVTGIAKNVLTIPSSALTKLGSRAIVRVLKDGEEQVTVVTVGVVGSTRTSITKGLTKGQTVVIADLNADLPSGGTTTNNRFGGGGNFPRISGGNFGGGAPVIRNR